MNSEETYRLESLINSKDEEGEACNQAVKIHTLEDCSGSMYDLLQEAYQDKDHRDNYSKFTCEINQNIQSGLTKFDAEHGNWVGGNLALLTGSSWDSLAACSMNIASHNIDLGVEESNSNASCLFFSLRKTSLMATLAFCAFQAGFSIQKGRTGELDADDWRELASLTSKVTEMSNLLLIDNSNDIRTLKPVCYQLRKRLHLKVIVIDGFELLNYSLNQDDLYYQNIGSYKDKEYAMLLKELKELAVALDVLIVCTMLSETRACTISGSAYASFTNHLRFAPDTVMNVNSDLSKVGIGKHTVPQESFSCKLIKI